MTKQIIPYLPIDLKEPKEIVDAVRARRGGTLLNLDRMLLNSPALIRGWNAHLKEIRENLTLDDKYKEIGMCGVAILNRAEYEFIHHAPELLKAGGTQAQVDEIRKIDTDAFNASLFDATELDVIALTVAMTRHIEVPVEVMERLQKTLGNQETVEMVAVVATYNMVSRFLIATGVSPESH
ncbi:carboxymuconolactone decarboxylase family protein [Polynucleobacter rarus]|jgi:alkylhydroperoxidase family enzyme|uniref:carboxymuconolactone decarboxylase family protein n=1 Tax=Polynucleobacter rarus TaxID=556055 RepID=UPI000D3E2B66|nr:carboxymuconolactone decarboxylase family protein [Polynucleobacter rarus]